MHVRRLLAFLLLLAVMPRATPAQERDPLERALAAYRGLDFDVAAERLRALLAPGAATPLSARDSLRALMHLGATEQFRDRRAAAAEAYTALLLAEPRYRPDALIFPPEVSALFDDVRRTVRAVSVVSPDSASIITTTDRLTMRLVVAGPHDVRALMLDPRGAPLRLLHEGTIADSVDIGWNARDAVGRLLEGGAYALLVTSHGDDGTVLRSVELPLLVERIAPDTLPTPVLDSSALRPETRAGRRSWRPVMVGMLAAGAAAALPAAVGSERDGLSLRYAVSAALGIAGVAGFLDGARPVPVAENVTWNRALRGRYGAEIERTREENARRRAEIRLRIATGSLRVMRTP